MTKYVLKRVAISAVTLLVILFVLYLMLEFMPGTPFNDEKLTDAQRLIIETKYGLNRPFLVRFVDYVVMMTGNEVYVSRTKSDSPIVLERMNENEATRSYYPRTASLKVTDSEKEYTVYGSGDIETSIELFPQAYKNAGWAFLVSCEMKENGNRQMVNVLFCGVGYRMIAPRFAWHAAQPDTEWNLGVASSCDSNTTIARLNISHL